MALVSLGPVRVVEVGTHLIDGAGDREMIVVEAEVHTTVSRSVTRSGATPRADSVDVDGMN